MLSLLKALNETTSLTIVAVAAALFVYRHTYTLIFACPSASSLDSPVPLPRLLLGSQVVQLGRKRLRQRVPGRVWREGAFVHVQSGADDQLMRASV